MVALTFANNQNHGQSVYEPYTFSTVAGFIGGPGETDGVGSTARFKLPHGLAADGTDTLYVADTENHLIRKVSAEGLVTTVAGAPHTPGAVDGPISAARFCLPRGIAVDRAGNLFVADTGNHTIRKIRVDGTVRTVAGLAGESGWTDGMGSQARFSRPSAIAVDGEGNLYVSDTGNSTIRKITSEGAVSTLAGLAGAQGRIDGTGSEARFIGPNGLAVDVTGTLFVADSYAIRRITPDRTVTTWAGRSVPGSVDGTGSEAYFLGPVGLAFDFHGDLFVSDGAIRKVTPAGVVTTIAGDAYLPGSKDGTGFEALFNGAAGVAVNRAGDIFVTDINNCTIRKVTTAGAVTTFAGLPPLTGSTDGTGSEVRFGGLASVALDEAGNAYLSDAGNCVIRKMTANGMVTTYAGEVAPVGGYHDGPAASARFNHPAGVALDKSGTLYVADSSNHLIRKVTPDGVVSTFAGKYVFDVARQFALGGLKDGPAAEAQFNMPVGMAVDPVGNLFVAEPFNNTIRKITPEGMVSTYAGSRQPGSANGAGAAARFNQPEGVAVDQFGNVYVADQLNHTIRKITPDRVVTTLAGSAGQWGSVDAAGKAARFSSPTGVAVDSAGNIYVTDSANHIIRKITSDGVVTTLAGLAGVFGGADGTGCAALFNYPRSAAVDRTWHLFVADGNALRQGTPAVALRSVSAQDGTHVQFGFVVGGPVGQLIVVQESADLRNWLPVSTNTLTLEGCTFTDALKGDSHRYYRALRLAP